MIDKKVLNAYCIIIGAVFIVSAVGKLLGMAQFVNLIGLYGLGYVKFLAPVIALLELTVGLGLVLLLDPRRYLMFALTMLMVYTAAFSYGYFKYGVTDCGCFGALLNTNISPIYFFLRNFILLGMLLLLWTRYPKQKVFGSPLKKVIIPAAFGIGLFIAAITFKDQAPQQNQVLASTSYNYQGQNINHTDIAKYARLSADSTYLVFCFSYTCPHCLNSIANLQQYKKYKLVDRIVALGIGADSSKQRFIKDFQPDFYIRDLDPRAMFRLTNLYPTAFFVLRDTIKAVVEGELPSPVVFKNEYMLAAIHQ